MRMLLLLISVIMLLLLDELIMACCQRRMGPLNLGMHGLLASIINGCNLIITQSINPKALNGNQYIGFTLAFMIGSIITLPFLFPFISVNAS